MTIRLAKVEDREEVFSLLDQLIAEVNRTSGKPPKTHAGTEARSEIFNNILQREDILIFVAEENGKLIAMTELFIVPVIRRGYYQGILESFVVTKDLRGKGIGSQLLKEVMKYCKEKKIKVIKLTSGNDLIDAHKFYEKHGAKFTEKMFRFDLPQE